MTGVLSMVGVASSMLLCGSALASPEPIAMGTSAPMVTRSCGGSISASVEIPSDGGYGGGMGGEPAMAPEAISPDAKRPASGVAMGPDSDFGGQEDMLGEEADALGPDSAFEGQDDMTAGETVVNTDKLPDLMGNGVAPADAPDATAPEASDFGGLEDDCGGEHQVVCGEEAMAGAPVHRSNQRVRRT